MAWKKNSMNVLFAVLPVSAFASFKFLAYIDRRRRDPNHDVNLYGFKLSCILYVVTLVLILQMYQHPRNL